MRISPDSLYRADQIVRSKENPDPILPVSRSFFLDKVARGEYPQPVRLSPGVTCWRGSDLLALLESFAKATMPATTAAPTTEATAPRRRGRPKGSKNHPKTQVEAAQGSGA